MGVNIKFSKKLANLGNGAKKLKSLAPVFKAIADLELSATKLRFIKQEDPDGKKWPDPITIRRDGTVTGGGLTHAEAWSYVVKSNYQGMPKGWHWFKSSDKIMRDTGVLFNSIQRGYTDTYAVVGTNISYGKTLQAGRFPFLGINKKTEDNIVFVLNKFLGGLLK